MQELRLALRGLRNRPGFALVVIATVALAVGVNTAIFSVVSAVLLKPLPYPHSEQLVSVVTQDRTYQSERSWFSTPEFLELQRDSRSFQSLAAYALGTATFGDIERPIRVPAAYTTWELLSTLGVAPTRGRYFDASEDIPGDPRVVVLGHELWERSFGADPSIVGRNVRLDGYSLTVIGVMPEGFGFPQHDVEAWIPLGLERGNLQKDRGAHGLMVLGRLRPSTSLEAARAELDALTRHAGTLFSATWHTVDPVEHPMAAFSLHSVMVGGARAPLWILQAAVLLILLIVCANIGNLLLARTESRNRELAIRAALGAGRAKLARLFLTETLVLGLAGGALGLGVAFLSLRFVVPFLPVGAPRASEIQVDHWALAFALACTLATSVAVGLVPFLHTRTTDLHARLSEGGLAATGRSRLRRFLVAGEVAAALILVLGCGVMLKSFGRLSQVNMGFRPEGLLSFELELPAPSYPSTEKRQEFWERLQGELGALPGVIQVTLSSQLPTATEPPTGVVWFAGAPPYTEKGAPVAESHVVGHRYFETLGMRLVRGRFLTPDDRLALVINESAAHKFFPGQDPVGQLMRVTPWVEGSPSEVIVGVVADAKQHGPDQPSGDAVFVPLRGVPEMKFSRTPLRLRVIVRAQRPESLASTVEAAVRRLDSSLPLSQVRTMDQVVWEAVAKPRFIAMLMSVFALLALSLAAIGVYGVMSYTVEQRTREIGVRVALGAPSRSVQGLVLRQTLAVALWGAGAGMVGALLAALLLRTTLSDVLFETAAVDPVVMLGVSVLILAVAGLASWIPARRASRVDPMTALRAE